MINGSQTEDSQDSVSESETEILPLLANTTSFPDNQYKGLIDYHEYFTVLATDRSVQRGNSDETPPAFTIPSRPAKRGCTVLVEKTNRTYNLYVFFHYEFP